MGGRDEKGKFRKGMAKENGRSLEYKEEKEADEGGKSVSLI